ncbi:putative alcohol-forming fatty acyl-CoA reductase [Helianthus annuus]|nr:putative alcohol-forming fatty acyl-CoA reductase [Helianthus annuus]
MEVNNIVQFLEDRTILVTGGTGFLAKVMVEKILRVQPNVRKLYLLIRACDLEEAIKRFQMEVAGNDLFRILREKHGANIDTFLSEKVTPVAGDITIENLGLRDYNLIKEMQREVDVVVNAAASTKFYERYDLALNINTFGAKHVSNFVLKCINMKVFLHISTAYVSSENHGLILEKQFKSGDSINGKTKVDINKEKELMEENLKQLTTIKATNKEIASFMKDLGIQRAKHHGWPNTYVFTKAMGEMLLGELRKDVPLVILRPSIVSSTYKEPFPGWIENLRTIDTVFAGYIKGTATCLRGDPDCIMDIVPVDMVVNAMIVAMAAHVNHPNSGIIYHGTSSASNPVKLHQIVDWSVEYFTKHPYISKDGSIKARDFKLLTSETSFQKYIAIHYQLPLKALKIANMVLCHALDGVYTDFSRKLQIGTLFSDLFKHYALSKAIYDDSNLKNLLNIYKENADDEAQVFFFNTSSINWKDYYMNTHLPGLVKYAIK